MQCITPGSCILVVLRSIEVCNQINWNKHLDYCMFFKHPTSSILGRPRVFMSTWIPRQSGSPSPSLGYFRILSFWARCEEGKNTTTPIPHGSPFLKSNSLKPSRGKMLQEGRKFLPRALEGFRQSLLIWPRKSPRDVSRLTQLLLQTKGWINWE